MIDVSSISDRKKITSRINTHDNFADLDLNDWIIKKINPKNTEIILDLGCGPGKQIFIIKNLYPYSTIFAFDQNQDSLNFIKNKSVEENIEKIHIIQGDLDIFDTKIDIKQNFDLIYSSFALYYSKNIPELIQKIKNKLIHNGRFFCCGPILGNNGELIKFQKNILGSQLQDVKYKMEDDVLPAIKTNFQKITVEYFNNPIHFPSADTVVDYWKSSWLFEPKIEQSYVDAINEYFTSHHEFVTTKKIIGIFAEK